MRGSLFPHALRGVATVAALALLGGCFPAPAATGAVIAVSEKDFAIEAPATIASGNVTFSVTNQGPATHEFVVVRSDLSPDDLPIGPDGLSADEDALTDVGEINQVNYGSTETLHLSLPPGRYVFFCNLEGHYLGGMHAGLVVTG
jgi:uncharacterized cupredoxin-like copper-binding protein